MKGNKPLNTFKAGSFAIVAHAISAKFRVDCYRSFVEIQLQHHKHAEFLNKRIEMYDELAIVVGKDMAIGSFAKSYIMADNGKEGVVDKEEKGKKVVESSTTGFTVSMSSKRGRAPPSDDSVLTDLYDQLKEIAMALKEVNRGPVDYTSLYSKVMAMASDGYSEDMLAMSFDHLCENKKAARGFLVKNAKLRKLWMDSYFFT
ncbi:hypothetical protein ACB092_05G033800 [Castanea dentata]